MARAIQHSLTTLPRPSWQAHVVSWLVAARMRPHARPPIDPQWVRQHVGKPLTVRRLMARSTGARAEHRPAHGSWPGGERLWWPTAMHRPTPPPTMLYLHGGGYIACSPETHRSLVGSLVRRTGCTAWVPRYRLAPEHPYPAALDDALAAYRHLVQTEGIEPQRLVVAGDSAGGGLALALVLALRDHGLPAPAAVVTYSPWSDLAATGSSLDENTERCAMFAGETIRAASRFYAGETDPYVPTLSPLYGDYRDFPPLLVHASADEVLRDDAVRVVERARAAGVPVHSRLWARVPHGWQFFAAVMPEARESLTLTQAFIAHHVT